MGKARSKQLDLVAEPTPSPKHIVENGRLMLAYPRGAKMREHETPDFYRLAAIERYPALSPEWQWYSIESMHGGFLLKGAVPLGHVVRGKRKGAFRWPPEHKSDRVLLTREDVEATKQRWQQRTHLCRECCGIGLVYAGFDEQHSYAHICTHCKGTGRWLDAPLPLLRASA